MDIARLRRRAVRLPRIPGEEPPSIECNEDAAKSPSTTERLRLCLVPTVAVVALCCAALAAAAGGQDRVTPESALLPDLDQEVPWDLEITRSGPGARPEFRLGFGSAVRNVGDGPLIISGRRRAAANGTMTADQIVESRGAGSP